VNRPDNIILEGVVGSRAYGLATPESDIDIKGVFVAPTREILGIYPVKDCYTTTEPDTQYLEVSKFISLALKCNPTILEMLYLSEYDTLNYEGGMLVEHRSAFLSEPYVRNAFGGYAVQQVRKLVKRDEEGKQGFGRGLRYAKHARHCFRLLDEAKQLLTTGTMSVKVRNRDEIFACGELSPTELQSRFEEAQSEIAAIKSVLPPDPNYERVNDMLLRIRSLN